MSLALPSGRWYNPCGAYVLIKAAINVATFIEPTKEITNYFITKHKKALRYKSEG